MQSLDANTQAERFAAMSAEEIRAYELDTLRRIADLALIPPVLNTSPLPQFSYDNLDYAMTLNIARTPQGRIWVAWVGGGDSPDAFFLLASSDDEGKTWSQPRLVINAQSTNIPMQRSILVGNIWTDPQGRLWLFFDQSMLARDGREGVWATVCKNPDADEPTWSPPRRIWHGCALNPPIILTTGEWMLAIGFNEPRGQWPFQNLFAELDPLRGINFFVSTDEGQTWQFRGRVKQPKAEWPEPRVIERKDGSLMLWARTTNMPHSIVQSVSYDRGATWSEPVYRTDIAQPIARFLLKRLNSGRLLLVKHGKRLDEYDTEAWPGTSKEKMGYRGRNQLTAWLSDDDGENWYGGFMLDERKDISYPEGFQNPEGEIFVSYDRNRHPDGEIWMARFTEEDIIAGKLVSPKSQLQTRIIHTPKKTNE